MYIYSKRISSQAIQREQLRRVHAAEEGREDGKEKGWFGGSAQRAGFTEPHKGSFYIDPKLTGSSPALTIKGSVNEVECYFAVLLQVFLLAFSF